VRERTNTLDASRDLCYYFDISALQKNDVKLIVDEKGEVTSARAEYKYVETACKELRGRGFNIPFLELKARAELVAVQKFSPQYKRIRVEAVRPESDAPDRE